MKHFPTRLPAWIIILLCIVTRLPQLCSQHLMLDGDECVVGLMAKHLYTGRELPLFFYGQQYGFSLVEELFIIPFYAALGVKAISVKIGMLLLWSLGVVYLHKALSALNKGNKYIPVLLTLILIATPAWAVWSMKARGGYLTAFTMSSALLYLLSRRPAISKTGWAIAGILLVFIYYSMPLWLPGMLLLSAYYWAKEQQRIQRALYLLVPAILLFISFYIYRSSLPQFYAPDPVSTIVEWPDHLLRIPDMVYTALHGRYYYLEVQQPNFVQAFCSISFCVVIIITVSYAIWRNERDMLLLLICVSILITIGITVLSPLAHYRYLLPLTVYILLHYS